MLRNSLILCASLMLAVPVAGFGGDEDDPTVVKTTLDAVRAAPGAYKNVEIQFPVQFAWVGKLENPFFTRFEARSYTNVQAWADGAAIWERDTYENVFGLLFLSKRSQQLKDLFRLKIYQRLQVTAVVRDTFQDQPWIEIMNFTPIEGGLNTATLAHLYRGHNFMESRRWPQAISEYSLAPVAGTPSWVKARVHKNLALCQLRIGEADAARDHITRAIALMGDDLDLHTWRLARTIENDPSLELDRSVSRTPLKDHERPLWEAFEEQEFAGDAAVPTPMRDSTPPR